MRPVKIVLTALFFIIFATVAYPAMVKSIRHKQTLSATVRITMIAPEMVADRESADDYLPLPPDEKPMLRTTGKFVVSEGLGTVVNDGNDLLIVTHDHYSVLDQSLGTVQFRNQDNELIMEMDLFKYKRLIRRRDGGTTVIEAPSKLASVYPVFGNPLVQLLSVARAGSDPVGPEDRVLIVRRDPGNADALEVTEAVVESLGEKQGRPVFRLRNLNGQPISGGDSGGGVWHEGQLVANLWTTIMHQDVATNAMSPTDFSLAALNS